MFILDVGGGAALNVFEVSEEEIIGERRRQGGRGAIDHFAIAVDSLETLEAVKQRLIDAGADIGEIQRLGSEWSLFFRDIDGMELEVCAASGLSSSKRGGAELADAVVDHPVVAARRQRRRQRSDPTGQAVAGGQVGAQPERGA